MIYSNITELVGKTPLVRLSALEREYGLESEILAKLELFNPAGSAKDRVAMRMLESAMEKGIIKKGDTVIEPTSGNTGIGLAAMGASLGISVILTMPETMSKERRDLLSAYGAKIVLTEGALGMKGAIDKALELKEEIKGAYIPSQFDNPENPKAHYETTGREIYEDTEGKLDFFVAGIGTGGTVSGVGRYLKEQNENIKVIGVEPEDSPMITKGVAGPHKLQGIGANFVPGNFDASFVDRVVTANYEKACETCRFLAHKEGILVGISSGAALASAISLAKEEKNKRIVVFLPDSGERYISTGIFDR